MMAKLNLKVSQSLYNYLNITCKYSSSTFKASDIKIEKCKKPAEKPDPNNLVFGKTFSDHMFKVEWSLSKGWGKPEIGPLHNLSIHPAAKVLHYSSELFEGLKAYRCSDNKIRLFRPDMNAKRMLRTAERATLPLFDKDELVKCIKKLVEIDQDWVPYSNTSSLYIRPTFIGTQASLGVSESNDAMLFVITGPVGPFFPTGFKPVSLLADPKYVRSWNGGCGSFKMGSNYGPTVMIQKEANAKGYQQVLWLYGEEHQVTEVGTMNLFIYWTNEKGENELVTPNLDAGLILPGVTRQSLLDLAREWNEFKVRERPVKMAELVNALKDNRLKEVFGAGTACVVCPVSRIFYNGSDLIIPSNYDETSLCLRFLTTLQNIQYGRVPHIWSTDINE